MDNCFIDITVEFLAVAFHSILYYASVYPKSIFETRKKYNVVVYCSTHPEVNQYINACLRSVVECLKSGQLKRIVFAVTDGLYDSKIKFVFDFDKSDLFDETNDAYLVQAEQNLRTFFLTLSSMSSKFNTPEDASFSISLHTTESTAVAMATNPDLEDFPLIEVDDKCEDCDRILPLRRFTIRDYSLDTYIELNC